MQIAVMRMKIHYGMREILYTVHDVIIAHEQKVAKRIRLNAHITMK